MKRVVVLGLMGQYPLGGMAWQVLHHVIGFRRLGYECFYVEESGAPPYSPRLQSVVDDARENVRFLAGSFRLFDLEDAWSYYDSLEKRWLGIGQQRTQELLEHAEVIVNLCGASRPDPAARRRGCMVYVETDPVLEQVKLGEGDTATRAFFAAHDVHFTYGWNLGTPACPLPTGDVAWRRTHPPVVVDLWEAPPRARARWRTFATYRNKGKDVVFRGETYYWSKHPNFERVMDLPSRTREQLELALVAPDASVRDRFLAGGWSLVDPYPRSRTAVAYRRYIRSAKGEFSVEKDDQVRLRTGWFSDRSVSFLAAGRPCVLQDTGFGERLPVGRGLLPWSTPEEAIDCLERVARDYDAHARAARQLALDHFEARVLLPSILEAAGV